MPRCWSAPRSAGSAGTCRCPTCRQAVSDIAIAVPTLHFDLLFNGLSNLAPLLATAIPLGVYNFAEAMSNVESAAAAGDSYNLRSVLLADGSGAIIGAALGSPFPPAVYIGHPGWKAAGGRGSYSMASGIFIAVLCFLGLFGVLNTVLPIPAIVPILLYIGLLIGAQAFQSVPRIQAAAVVAAILPNLASWGTGSDRQRAGRGRNDRGRGGTDALGNAGLVYDGLKILGEGAVLAGMVLGSIVAFILMHKFYAAAIAAGVGAVLSWIGLIHASEVAWAAQPEVALGYAMLGIVLVAFAFHRRNEPEFVDAVERGRAHRGLTEPDPLAPQTGVGSRPPTGNWDQPRDGAAAAPCGQPARPRRTIPLTSQPRRRRTRSRGVRRSAIRPMSVRSAVPTIQRP